MANLSSSSHIESFEPIDLHFLRELIIPIRKLKWLGFYNQMT